MGILDWIFGFELFPELEMDKKFRYDARFNEKCCICRNGKRRYEGFNPMDIPGIVDSCINDSREKRWLSYKTNENCSNFEDKK